MRQASLFGLPDHLRKLSATGDPLEVLAKVVDFEIFRAPLEAALGYSDGSKGGRPAYDAVAMFKVLILAARHTVSDERMEFLIRDRLSWLRFLGFDLGAPTPDRNTIWTFRERLIRAGAMDELFAAFDGERREPASSRAGLPRRPSLSPPAPDRQSGRWPKPARILGVSALPGAAGESSDVRLGEGTSPGSNPLQSSALCDGESLQRISNIVRNLDQTRDSSKGRSDAQKITS